MKKLLITVLLLISATQIFAQTECYIKYSYDASGNRIKREFICAGRDTLLGNPPIGLRRPNTVTCNTTEVTVYPNPSTGVYTVAFSLATKDAFLQIINFSGQQVLEKPLQELKSEVDISNLANGLYTFVIKTSWGIESRRVVKISSQ
jgi:Secretion system C-terminal sorting domain